MHARGHTHTMLHWWRQTLVDRADLAVRRAGGTMIWHHDLDLRQLPLGWAAFENARGADVYIRPARGRDWPLLFLDDVAPSVAAHAARVYDVLCVETSPAGGFHLWLRSSNPLDETRRRACQRHLASLIGADPASTSGEHLGRLAGYRNHKREGPWVNVSTASLAGRCWEPPADLPEERHAAGSRVAQPAPMRASTDRSPSGEDWAWVCKQIECGANPELVVSELTGRCRSRRGRDSERYARRTVNTALSRVKR